MGKTFGKEEKNKHNSTFPANINNGRHLRFSSSTKYFSKI